MSDGTMHPLDLAILKGKVGCDGCYHAIRYGRKLEKDLQDIHRVCALALRAIEDQDLQDDLEHAVAQLRKVLPVPCTAVSARWCPNCGQCMCKDPGDLNDDSCPLHSQYSPHGEKDREDDERHGDDSSGTD